jgi:hypothetical protein
VDWCVGVGVWGVGVWGCGGAGGVGVWGHSLRSTFHRLHLLRLWTPTILQHRLTATLNSSRVYMPILVVLRAIMKEEYGNTQNEPKVKLIYRWEICRDHIFASLWHFWLFKQSFQIPDSEDLTKSVFYPGQGKIRICDGCWSN